MNSSSDGGVLLDELVEQLATRIAEQLHQLQRQTVRELAPAQRSPWLNISDAADYLRWPKQRLYKLTASGGIPHYKHEGRLLFHRDELDQWLRSNGQGQAR